MKRRDFIKLPALIPGLKKLLDDFTIPEVKEETPVSNYLKSALDTPDKSDRQYGPLLYPHTSVPTWDAFVFDEQDIEDDRLICKVKGVPSKVFIRNEAGEHTVFTGPVEFFMKSKETLEVSLGGVRRGIVFAEVYGYG